MAHVNDAVADLYGSGSGQADAQSKNRRMTEHSRKWSSSGLGLDAAEAEARRLEKKGTFSATMDDEAGTVTLSKDDFKAVMGKLGGHKQVAKRSQSNLVVLAFGYLAVSIGFIAVIVGLMNWRIEATKESHVVGNSMVGKDGKAVKTADLINYAGLFDLPKFDTKTLVETKKVSMILQNGKEMSFEITGALKRPGSKRIELLTPGGVVRVNGDSMRASATVNGKCYKAQVPTKEETRRLLSTDRSLLHSRATFFGTPGQGRGLSATTPGGWAGLAMLIGDEVQDNKDGKDAISGNGLIRLEFENDFNNNATTTLHFQFELNAVKIPTNGFDEDCEKSTFEVYNKPGKLLVMGETTLPGAEKSSFVFRNAMILAKGTSYNNGTLLTDSCQLVSETELAISSDAAATKEDLVKLFIQEIPEGYTAKVEFTKDEVFKNRIDEDAIRAGCSVAPNSSPQMRRLAGAIKDDVAHFKEFYHDPIMEELNLMEEHEMDEHHRAMKEHLPYILELKEHARRRLRSYKDDAQDAYDASASTTWQGSGKYCSAQHSVSYWNQEFTGTTCYYARMAGNKCVIAFEGSQQNSDWADNILGAFKSRVGVGGADTMAHTNYGAYGLTVHHGFKAQYETARALMDQYGHSSMSCPGGRVWVGHSLGGGMALMARLHYGSGETYTYAAPGVTKDSRNYNFGGKRFWHKWDPVPYAANLAGYKHISRGSVEIEPYCSAEATRQGGCSGWGFSVPYPCSCGWRGCNSCRHNVCISWATIFLGCENHGWRHRLNNKAHDQPKVFSTDCSSLSSCASSVGSTISGIFQIGTDIFRNIVGVFGGQHGTHYHSMAEIYRPNANA